MLAPKAVHDTTDLTDESGASFWLQMCSVRLHGFLRWLLSCSHCLSVLYVSMWLSLSRSMRRTAMRQGLMRICGKRRQKMKYKNRQLQKGMGQQWTQHGQERCSRCHKLWWLLLQLELSRVDHANNSKQIIPSRWVCRMQPASEGFQLAAMG